MPYLVTWKYPKKLAEVWGEPKFIFTNHRYARDCMHEFMSEAYWDGRKYEKDDNGLTQSECTLNGVFKLTDGDDVWEATITTVPIRFHWGPGWNMAEDKAARLQTKLWREIDSIDTCLEHGTLDKNY